MGSFTKKQNAFSLMLLTCTCIALFRCEAFHSEMQHGLRRYNQFSKVRHPTTRNVLAEPPQDIGVSPKKFPRARNGRPARKRRNPRKKEDVWSSGRWARAVRIESGLLNALEALQQSIKGGGAENSSIDYSLRTFPDIRDCNAALAAFGDGGDLLRALRLYFKMRKAASLGERYLSQFQIEVPTPTLVTFSTIMSRAVQLGKPLVAVRLWNIMRRQPDFFSSTSSVPKSQRIVPDVRAANILMNCYSKLGNLDSAQDLLEQMLSGDGADVPGMTPNIVTYNTLLDACHKSGELDAALLVKEKLDSADIRADARTYTTLIATVARKASDASGANDPSPAFQFLQEMQARNIRPNGMTYSALIDVCGRCQRSDLALKGLRMMLDQKAHEQQWLDISAGNSYTLAAEVGAWTAAINACGKAGRIKPALRLFKTMPNFGVTPNAVTCGALTDCLLRHGKTAESLEVLRYMKKNRIAPSEVMYTSLMTSAVRLARLENEQQRDPRGKKASSESHPSMGDSSTIPAVEIYTELMASLVQAPRKKTISTKGSSPSTQANEDSDELFKVSLVFKEMQAAGVKPDIACFNVLLKSCANSGDVDRARQVLDLINESEDLVPNDASWREMMRASGKAGRIDLALSTWKAAVEATYEKDEKTGPRKNRLSDKTLGALLASLVRGAEDDKVDRHTRLRLYQLVVKIYEAVTSGSSYLGAGYLNKQKVLGNAWVMIMFLQALVSLEKIAESEADKGIMESSKLRSLAASIIALECFSEGLPLALRKNPFFSKAYNASLSWRSSPAPQER